MDCIALAIMVAIAILSFGSIIYFDYKESKENNDGDTEI